MCKVLYRVVQQKQVISCSRYSCDQLSNFYSVQLFWVPRISPQVAFQRVMSQKTFFRLFLLYFFQISPRSCRTATGGGRQELHLCLREKFVFCNTLNHFFVFSLVNLHIYISAKKYTVLGPNFLISDADGYTKFDPLGKEKINLAKDCNYLIYY